MAGRISVPFRGALAQEETLCRSSALYLTLEGDPMYEAHSKRAKSDATDWSTDRRSLGTFRDVFSPSTQPKRMLVSSLLRVIQK